MFPQVTSLDRQSLNVGFLPDTRPNQYKGMHKVVKPHAIPPSPLKSAVKPASCLLILCTRTRNKTQLKYRRTRPPKSQTSSMTMNMTARTTLIQRYVTLFRFAGFSRLEGTHAHALLTSYNYSQQVLPEVDAPKQRHRLQQNRGTGTVVTGIPSKEAMLAMQHLTRAQA